PYELLHAEIRVMIQKDRQAGLRGTVLAQILLVQSRRYRHLHAVMPLCYRWPIRKWDAVRKMVEEPLVELLVPIPPTDVDLLRKVAEGGMVWVANWRRAVDDGEMRDI